MSRTKLFIENFVAYGLISIINKIVPLLLLPIITRMLPNTEDFGIYDLFSLILGLGSPLVVMGLYDAMFREYFEKEEEQYRIDVITTTQRIVMISSTIVCALLFIFNKYVSFVFFGEMSFGIIITYSALGVFLSGNLSIIQAPTRIQNERKVFVFSGLIQSLSQYSISIVLVFWGFSYFGLIHANILTSGVMVFFFWVRNKRFFLSGKYNKSIAKELFKVGLPLLPTFLVYWLYNSMDKIMITNMLGTGELGVYSIGAKLSSISQLLYTAFAGGYAFFKYTTMKDNDQIEMNSKLFEYLSVITIITFSLVTPFSRTVFNLLFIGEYVRGYVVFPFLFLSPLLLMLYQILASQFVIIKKSIILTFTLWFGVFVNILFNIFLIPCFGIIGAAISTLIGYMSSLFFVILISRKWKIFKLNRRLLVVYLTLIIEILAISIGPICIYVNGITVFLSAILYKKELSILVNRIKNKKRGNYDSPN